MTNPSDGRITSLATFTAGLVGSELMMIVSPPTAAAGVNYNLPISTFTAAIGTLPPGGLAGQVLENLGGGVNFSTAWTGLASLISGTTGISVSGSTSLVIGVLVPNGTIGQVLENLGGTSLSTTAWTGLSSLITGSTGIAVAGITSLGIQLASTVGLSVLGVGATATAVPAPIGPGTADQVLIVNHAGTGLAFGPATPGSLPSALIREPAGTTSIQLATTDLMVGLDSSVGTVTAALPICASWVAVNPFTVTGLLVRDVIGSASITTGINFTTSGSDTFRSGIQPRIRNPFGVFRFYPSNAKTAWDVG